MLSELLRAITEPFTSYFDLTITQPCKCLAQQHDKDKRKKKQQKTADAQHFSMLKLMKKQREMCSPKTNQGMRSGSLRDQYVKDTYRAPSSADWLH